MKGTKVRNVHTGEVLTVVDVDDERGTQPVYVLSDGARRNQDVFVAHWRVVEEDDALVGERIRLRWRLGETGTIVEVREREYLSPLYTVVWDDKELGEGTVYEYEFEVIG